MQPTPCVHIGRANQRGTTAVEFALVAGVFFMLLIGVMEMGRVLFYWNTATEATRLGARIAAVCNVGDGAVAAKMSSLFPLIGTADIDVLYEPTGCTVDTCEQVTVSIRAGIAVNTMIPYVSLSIPLPPFSTRLPRESLLSTVDGISNPVCN